MMALSKKHSSSELDEGRENGGRPHRTRSSSSSTLSAGMHSRRMSTAVIVRSASVTGMTMAHGEDPAPDDSKDGPHDAAARLDTWLENNSVRRNVSSRGTFSSGPATAADKVPWHEKPTNSSKLVSGCERLHFEVTEVCERVDDRQGLLKTHDHEIHFVTEWTLFFNMMTVKEEVDYLQLKVPILQLAWFFFFHKYILLLTKSLLVYVILCELIAYCAWPGYTLGFVFSYGAAYLALHLSAGVIKGTGDALSVTSFHDSKTVRKTTKNPFEEIVVDIKSQNSLCVAIKEFFRVSFQVVKSIPSLFKQGRKKNKSGAVKVKSFYDLMETGTEYLSTLRWDDKTFKPTIYTSYFLVFSIVAIFVLSIGFLFASWVSASKCQKTAFHNNDYCSRTMFFFIVEVGGFIRFACSMLTFGTIFSGFAALLYGADVANALTSHWLTRFGPFRTLVLETSEHITDEEIEAFKPLIRRDASERYLFANFYMASASKIWGTYLVLMVLTNFGLFCYGYFLIIWEISKYGSSSPSLAIGCVLNLFMTMFVITCMSYANAAVVKIQKSFLYSAVDDFSVFGDEGNSGRRVWLDYVAETPIYWNIFGFALTRAWLGAFIGGAISTIGGAAVLVLLGLGG